MRHIWVQLFARAQYPFANSAEYAVKNPLGRRGRTQQLLNAPYDPTNEDSVKNLGQFIPYFDNDPKLWFLDERPDEDNKPPGEMDNVTAEEFLELMSFR